MRLAAAGALLCSARARAAPSDYVNTLRGTSHVDGSGALVADSKYSRGNTVPAVTWPLGFNFWIPLTQGDSGGWPYRYSDSAIQGFACSHQVSAWGGDLASFQIMPEVGAAITTGRAARSSAFSHANETAQAHYYSVTFDNGIKTEIAPTNHASAWRFTYPAGSPKAFLFWDTGDADIVIDTAARTVSGSFDKTNGSYCAKPPCNELYFYATFSKPGASAGYPAGGGAYIELTTTPGEVVTMSLATSFISLAQAKSNLGQEIGAKSFDTVKAEAAAEWDALLGKITLSGASADELTTFYSSLYRAFVYPNARWENVVGVGPRYFSPYNSSVMDGKMYVNNGLWDTYRATRPLTVLLAPSSTAEILDGFVNAYREGGWAPRWSGAGYRASMLGSHSDIVFADAYLKGVTDFDYEAAYESMLKNATVYSELDYAGRKCLEYSTFRQYCPDESEPHSAAWFLEDTVNDYAIALMAQKLGRSAEHAYFSNRALLYVNQFSPSAAETLPGGALSKGFFRGKKLDGSWRTSDADFKAREWGYEFTEGNAWHYIAAAPQDPLGLGNLYGRIAGDIRDARAALSNKLEQIFLADRNYLTGSYGGVIHEMAEAFDLNRGQYAHSNQPVHQLLYLNNYAGTPWKTQQHVRDVLASFFASGLLPGEGGFGYRGDEDGGEQSSWYIFSVLGFFPTSPGHLEYAIGSPPYASATLTLENGNTFTTTTVDNGVANVYVQSAKLNGASYTKNYLTHEQITAGGTLELTMGPSPSTWGSAPEDTPPSLTATTARLAVPMETKELGGVVSSSAPGAAATSAEKALDGDSSSEWLAESPAPSVSYQFPSEHRYSVLLYTLTSAAAQPERDPKSWTVEGSNDGTAFTVLDTRTDEVFDWRRQTKVYALENTTAYAFYRLAISANQGDAARTQLAELDFISAAPVIPRSASSDGVACSDASDDAANAIDGAGSTKWCSAAAQDAQWLEVDLGASRPVQQFRVKHAGAGGESVALNTRAFDISLSSDDATWNVAVSVTDNTASVTQHTIAPTEARYVKLIPRSSEQGAGARARIYEFEVYAPAFCEPEDDAQFCERLGKACGSLTETDNCGLPRTVASCGSCEGSAGGGAGGASASAGNAGVPAGGAGAASAAGAATAGGAASAADDSGCGCRGAGRSKRDAGALGLGVLVLAALALRRRAH